MSSLSFSLVYIIQQEFGTIGTTLRVFKDISMTRFFYSVLGVSAADSYRDRRPSFTFYVMPTE